MSNYNSPARRFSVPAFAPVGVMPERGAVMSEQYYLGALPVLSCEFVGLRVRRVEGRVYCARVSYELFGAVVSRVVPVSSLSVMA